MGTDIRAGKTTPKSRDVKGGAEISLHVEYPPNFANRDLFVPNAVHAGHPGFSERGCACAAP